MKPTIEGLSTFDFECISWNNEEKGLELIEGRSKSSIFDENIIIPVEDGELRSNDTLKTSEGKIINFEENAFKTVKNNRESKQKNGIVFNFEEISGTKRRGRPSKQTSKPEETR